MQSDILLYVRFIFLNRFCIPKFYYNYINKIISLKRHFSFCDLFDTIDLFHFQNKNFNYSINEDILDLTLLIIDNYRLLTVSFLSFLWLTNIIY